MAKAKNKSRSKPRSRKPAGKKTRTDMLVQDEATKQALVAAYEMGRMQERIAGNEKALAEMRQESEKLREKLDTVDRQLRTAIMAMLGVAILFLFYHYMQSSNAAADAKPAYGTSKRR